MVRLVEVEHAVYLVLTLIRHAIGGISHVVGEVLLVAQHCVNVGMLR